MNLDSTRNLNKLKVNYPLECIDKDLGQLTLQFCSCETSKQRNQENLSDFDLELWGYEFPLALRDGN